MTTNLNGSNGSHAKTSWPEQEGVSDMASGSEKHSPHVRHPRSATGWRPERCWTDSAELFSVHELVAA